MSPVALVRSRNAKVPQKMKTEAAVPAARSWLPTSPYQVVDRMAHAAMSRRYRRPVTGSAGKRFL